MKVMPGFRATSASATVRVRSYVTRRYASSFSPTALTPRQKKQAS